MRALELKIPPVVVLLAAAIGMVLCAYVDPTRFMLGDIFQTHKITLASMCFMAGAAVGIAGVVTFKKARTTVNPINIQGASQLVTRGIYRYSRNPMYVGMVFILLALAIRLHSPLSLIGIAGFMLYMTVFQIQPEERMLKELFGAAYEEYMTSVRRWI